MSREKTDDVFRSYISPPKVYANLYFKLNFYSFIYVDKF